MTPNEFQQAALRTNLDHPQAFAVGSRIHDNLRSIDLVHAQLGILSEAGEIADTLKKHFIYNQPLDYTNLKEEVGDILWYIAVLCNVSKFTIEDAMIANIEKLKLRYPSQFSEEHAAKRLDKVEAPIPFSNSVCKACGVYGHSSYDCKTVI